MDEIQQHRPCKQNRMVVPQDELSNGMDENRCVWMQLTYVGGIEFMKAMITSNMIIKPST
jgi:hypothetical protein